MIQDPQRPVQKWYQSYMVTMDRSFAVQGRYRIEEDEDPKTEYEDDHGHVTIGQKRKKIVARREVPKE